MTVLVVLIVTISIAMMVAVDLGRRRGNARLQAIVNAMEAAISATQRDYIRLTGSCYAFDYSGTAPHSSVQGTLLILPRFAPLYVPIARSIGRSDLLRITLHTAHLPLGIGSIVRDGAPLIPFNEAIEDPDLQVHKLSTPTHSYHVFAFNPMMRDRLSALAAGLDEAKHFLQLTCDHRDGTIRLFVIPNPEKLQKELSALLEITNSLTAE